ncbi:MAG: hypothetical protein IIZ67_03720 [Bacilli bacterium]|nr:hypothetical protein [Bacilli bacterium]
MKVEERTFRLFEVSFCIMSVIILVMLCVVIYFLGEKNNPYDVNRDGRVDLGDVIRLKKVVEGMDNGEGNV